MSGAVEIFGDAGGGQKALVRVTSRGELIGAGQDQNAWYGKSQTVTTNFTKSTDINTYTAGDVISSTTATGGIITFSAAVRFAGGGGRIQSAYLIDSEWPATKLKAALYLFTISTVTVAGDNAAFAPIDADMRSCVGVILFDGTSATAGIQGQATTNGYIAGQFFGAATNPICFNCAAADTALYGVLTAQNAYVPLAAERFDIFLNINPD